MTFSRRVFLKLSVTSAGSFLVVRFGAGRAFALPVEPTLDPESLAKFVTPLLVPPVMPRAGTLTLPGGKPADYYEISMRQISQQILPAGQPPSSYLRCSVKSREPLRAATRWRSAVARIARRRTACRLSSTER